MKRAYQAIVLGVCRGSPLAQETFIFGELRCMIFFPCFCLNLKDIRFGGRSVERRHENFVFGKLNMNH